MWTYLAAAGVMALVIAAVFALSVVGGLLVTLVFAPDDEDVSIGRDVVTIGERMQQHRVQHRGE